MDANDAASYVQELAGDDANIIFGAMYDDTYTDEASITVIATGLDSSTATQPTVNSRKVSQDSRNEQPQSSLFQRTIGSATQAGRQAGTAPSNGRLRTPSSNVEERDIQIPDFLRRR